MCSKVSDFHSAYLPQACTLVIAPEKLGTRDFALKRRSPDAKTLQAR